MNPEDWNQIKQVFSAALALPPAERDAYVRGAAVDQPGLSDAVAELLRAHYGASQSFLEPGSVMLSAPWLLRDGDSVARRFTVIRRIARGAMGEVYQASDERLRQAVALKAIRPELIGDADAAERFRREVLVTRNIGHACLCKVFDLVEHQISGRAGVPDGTVVPCLTMQLLEGESLEQWLSGRRPITPAEALPLITQIGDALQTLHDARRGAPRSQAVERHDGDDARRPARRAHRLRAGAPAQGRPVRDEGAGPGRRALLHGARTVPRRSAPAAPRTCTRSVS